MARKVRITPCFFDVYQFKAAYSKQVKHAVQIYRFTDVNLILRLGHVVEQEFQNHGAAETTALDLEIGKSHGYINILNVIDTDERRVLHRLGKAVALITIRRNADVVGAVFTETLAADIFITGLAVIAAEPAALVAEKLNLGLLNVWQGIQLIKGLVQPEIRHHIAKLGSVQFVFKVTEICQHLGG